MSKGKAITVRFSPEDMKKLEKYAAKDNRPVANLIYHVALCYVQEQEKEEKKMF